MRRLFAAGSLIPGALLTAFLCCLPGLGAAEQNGNPLAGAPAEDPVTSSQQEQPPLQPMRTTYGASINRGISINGTAVRTLEQQDDGRWAYRFNVDSFIADIRESVIFDWDKGQVIPHRYQYSLQGFAIRNRSRVADFNWPAGTVHGSYDGKSFSHAVGPGALDPLSFQLQLMLDLKAGKTEMQYAVVDRSGFDDDRFAVIGEEVLDSAIGRVGTVKVEKVRGEGSKRETLMWFAPELDYLLIRLEQTEPDGTRYEVRVESVELLTEDSQASPTD